MIQRPNHPPVVLFLMVGIVACSDRESPDSALESVLVVSTAGHASLEAFEFRATGSVAWLDDRTVVVIDRHDQQLVALDISDASERRAARRGQGPGELTGGITLAAHEGGVLVMAVRNRNMTFFGRGAPTL